MFIKKITENDIQDIVELQKEIYPNKLHNENINTLNDLEIGINSLGAYSKRKLIGYINIFSDEYGIDLYVSEIVSKNPRALYLLLIQLVNNHYDCDITFVFTESQYNLFNKIFNKYNYIINIMDEKLITEDVSPNEIKYRVIVSLQDNFDLRENIFKKIYDQSNKCVALEDLFLYLKSNYSLELISLYKKTIIRNLNARNLDFLNTIGPDFKFIIERNTPLLRSIKHCFLNSLTERGYQELEESVLMSTIYEDNKKYKSLQLNKTFSYSHYKSLVTWCDVRILDNSKFNNNTIGYYRWQIKNIIKYFKGKKFIKRIHILDQNENILMSIDPTKDYIYTLIPRNYTNILDYKLKELEFIEKIKKLFIDELNFKLSSEHKSAIVKIRKNIGENITFEFLEKICENEKEKDKNEDGKINVLSFNLESIFYATGKLISNKKYLTKGVLIYLLNSTSLNLIERINIYLNSMSLTNISLETTKEIRKYISYKIRKGTPVDIVMINVFEIIDREYLKELNIYEDEDIYGKFINYMYRLRLHKPLIKINTLFETFKKNTISIVAGLYEGYFSEEIYNYNLLVGKLERKCSPEYVAYFNSNSFHICNSDLIENGLEKGYGVFNVYLNDIVISTSTLFVNKAYNCLVLQNIKLNNIINYEIKEIDIKNIYKIMLSDILSKYGLDFAVEGFYNNNLLLSYSNNCIKTTLKPLEIKNIKSSMPKHVSVIALLNYICEEELVKEELDIINLIDRLNNDIELEESNENLIISR